MEVEQQAPEVEDNVAGVTTANYQESVDPNLVVYQLNIDELTQSILSKLKKFEVEEGLQDEIMTVIEMVANRNTYLSNLSEAEVLANSHELHQSIVDALFQYGSNLEVSQKNILMASIGNLIFTSLKRPFNQGERVFLSKTSEFRQIVQPRQSKGGLLGGLFKKWS
jgi:hypothetical protein